MSGGPGARRARTARAAVTAAALVGLLLTAGCSTTLEDLPLPGTGVAGETVELELELADALNLARGAVVKVDGVDSGRVQDVGVEDFTARATVLVESSARVRRGATVRLRYTTPLGELFVDVDNPEPGSPRAGALLADGDVVALRDTSTAPTVEDTLAQASLLVNGGGLDQLGTLTEELNAALGGREATARRLLDRTRRFLAGVDAATGDLDRALRALDRVATTLRDRERTVDRALRDVAPAARVLRRSTDDLTSLLAEIERFAAAAGETVRVTRADLLQVVEQLGPVLDELGRNEATYGPSLDSLVAAAAVAERVVPGDYGNIRLDLALDTIVLPLPVPVPGVPEQPGLPGAPLPPLPVPGLPPLPGLTGLPGLPLLSGLERPVEGADR